ncbi:MAG: hypothetical protein SF172_04685 [Burkholderiales bacterium]|nr:hypothetical protein [Burkholderiales bacterium]
MPAFDSIGDQKKFLQRLTATLTSSKIETLLSELPVASELEYQFDEDNPKKNWTPGKLHWIPIGRKRGNAGQVALAKRAIAPIAERLINGMEAIVELHRRREIDKANGHNCPPPQSPRAAVQRYFGLPPLNQLPMASEETRKVARELAKNLLLKLDTHKAEKEFSIQIRDKGIGQTPGKMHSSLLSLSSSDKGDKPYLIGVFGQGGSSTYRASEYSWVISRRASDQADGDDGLGWTIVKHIHPKGRRDHYYAYLAMDPEGKVPFLSGAAADVIGLKHGTWFCHVSYDFGPSRAAITRSLYQQLNHVLYDPVYPFDTEIAGTEATIYGNGYRLSNMKPESKDLDKTFDQLLDR